MGIKFRFPPYLMKFTDGQEVVELAGHTVGECLDNLEILFPSIKQRLCDEQGQLFSFYCIYINSDSINSEELDRPVNDGDEITIVPIMGGG